MALELIPNPGRVVRRAPTMYVNAKGVAFLNAAVRDGMLEDRAQEANLYYDKTDNTLVIEPARATPQTWTLKRVGTGYRMGLDKFIRTAKVVGMTCRRFPVLCEDGKLLIDLATGVAVVRKPRVKV